MVLGMAEIVFFKKAIMTLYSLYVNLNCHRSSRESGLVIQLLWCSYMM